jgi:hypothetical protein
MAAEVVRFGAEKAFVIGNRKTLPANRNFASRRELTINFLSSHNS